MAIDLATVRAQTPASKKLIHFNNAGSSLSPQPAHEALLTHLALEQEIGGYEAAVAAAPLIENFYFAFATLLNCSASEIAWANNATEAWNTAFHAIPLQEGDRILTGQSEYASNFMSFLHLQKHRNVQVEIIPNNAQGSICLERLETAITPAVKLIALTHAPSQSGTIHPAIEVGRLARKHDILYLLDACQSAGQIDLDVMQIGCHMLAGTGRKYLRGPRGTGFLYVSKECLDRIEPFNIDMHSARWLNNDSYEFEEGARRFETFECFVAGKIALGSAVDYALQCGMPDIEARVRMLAASLRTNLCRSQQLTVHDQGDNLSGIVTFSKGNENAADLQRRLLRKKINTSVVKASNNVLDFGQRRLGDVNRASVHYFNTETEIQRFCEVVTEV